ncbi:MAG: flagellar export protein FliJ [Phycisphaerae bacterium]|jgi:flagellar export protein FliJ|nr:flagellar export protein FliJ [Phycisphaerae bacterium]
MAKFEFKFEALYKLRKMKQEQTERELAQRLNLHHQHLLQVEKINAQIDEHYNQIRQSRLVGNIQITGLIADRRYLNQLHAMKLHQIASLAKSRQLVDTARSKVAQAKKQTDIMTKLKEKMLQQYQKEMLKRETIELDDLANAKAAWQRRRTR